jgi:anti-sigma-K factor RskA
VNGIRVPAALSERGILVPFDMDHALRHPDAAGWVLGALDLREARSFDDHLQSCGECRVVVAEFQVVAEALKDPATAAGPPPDLEAKTVAAVQYAVLAASRTPPGKRKASRWWHVH